tara:strand:+ start:401 stop:1249 length:849 start_codon:yes stop_codon:yes gene_type:complete
MRYTFVSLGRFESLGVRFGGAGLGNILFPWARAILYAKRNNVQRIQTTWRTLKVGTFFRGERDKRMYFDLFSGKDGISGFQKFLLLNFSNKVKVFSGMDDLFEPFKKEHAFITSELFKIINPSHIKKISNFNNNSIGIHVRMGDFETPNNEKFLRNGHWNYRLPIKWYVAIIEKIRLISNVPIFIFSDATDKELADILTISNCSRAYFGSAISDIIALSRCKVLVSSASTFSMWASFLGQTPTIWFPGQMRQKLILKQNIFEGEIDYTDKLPSSIIKTIAND